MNPFRSIAAGLLMLGVTLASDPLCAQSFGDDVRVNSDTAGAVQGSPWIQVGPDGRVHVAWIEVRNGAGPIMLATSDDGGRTFAAARRIVPGHTALAAMQRGAQFVIDRRGGMHMVWQERIVAGRVSAMYARSLDGGVTFSTPILAAADSGRYDQDFPSVAVDSSDNVSIAWIDNREIELGTSTQTHLYFTRSTDRGASFSAPVRASRMPGGEGGSCECCNTAIATTPEGTIFIAFRGNVDNRRDVHVARTSDGGTTFDVFAAASQNWLIGACPMTGSSIAVDRRGTAHVVWRDSRQISGGRDIIYYATLGRDADGCSADLAISDSPKRTNFPTIGVTPAGAVVVAWQDTRSDASDIHTTYSLDGGNTFAPSTPAVSASLLTRQELAVIAIGADGTRYAVWQDLRRDAGDITLARDASPLETIAPGAVAPAYPLDGASVTALTSIIWRAPEGLGEARQVVYDVAITGGADTARTNGLIARSLDVALAPGSYAWWVTARSSVGERTSGPFRFTLQSASAIASDAGALDARFAPSLAAAADGATLRLALDRPTLVTVTLFDRVGRRVGKPIASALDAGARTISIGAGLPPGSYYCRVDAAGLHRTLGLLLY